MSSITIYPGTSVSITINVSKVSDSSAIDPTTLALVIGDPDGNQTVKAISDLTHGLTGAYTYIHRFPITTNQGTARIRASADLAIDASAVTNISTVIIERLPSNVA